MVDESNGLDINAGSAPDGIYIDGAYNSMVLDVVNSGAGLTLSGLTIQHGDDDPAGGIYVEGSHFGQFSEGTYVHLTNSEVTGNVAHGSQVDKYSFASGGGITNRGYLVVDNSTIYDNESVASGDIYPVFGGGGINNLGRAVISDSTISSNDADQFGGGIFQGFTNYPTYLNVSNTEISDNLSYLGGGVATSSFFGVTPDEGSVGNVGSNIGQLVDSTITGNHAVSGAGVGIKYLGGNAKWKISHSTISENETSDNGGDGGGLSVGLNFCCGPYNFTIPNGTLNVLDSTISGNYASNSGGGAAIGFNAQKYEDTVQFNNSTIASNEANYDGGGLYLGYTDGPYYFSTPVFSTIVGDNTAAGAPNDLGQGQSGLNAGTRAAATGGAFDLSFSLVEVPGNAQFIETPAGSNIFGLDPQLGPLADNGGPTFTHLPSINSPVVDKGSAPGNLTTDQRGQARTVDTGPANAHDGTDIGSVELPTGPAGPAGPAGAAPPAKTKVGTLKKKHKKRRRVLRTKNAVTKVRITFRSNVPGGTFRCSVDGGAFEPCSS
ncbi:MAG TPA: choice-of-anchor Q domain-containing protein, partial [Actinomycetota bacterium]|nr:choice-of-anchor Q domain-containing protein [Actinomycetota bacterium]